MKKLFAHFAYFVAFSAMAIAETPTVSNLSARQRYPWNGLVDIECDIAYGDANADLYVSIVATNTATGEVLPVRTVHVADGVGRVVKAGHGTFVWDAGVDAPNVKIDDVALTVDVGPLGGVQLWAGGPYWAECNVGANKPEEYGYYFWWGDTVGYRRNAGDNGWVSVKDGTSFSFSSGNCPTNEKDNSTLRSLGYIDASGNLVAAHDAATAHLGAPWRMPTDAEFSALINNCDTEWTTRNGVYGRLVKGRGAYASKSIFLPAAGRGLGSSLYGTGSYGSYWSSTPSSDYSYYAWYLYFDSGYFYFSRDDYYFRCLGQSVRPLRAFAETSGEITVSCGATTHLALDTREGPRALEASETITYNPAWGDGSTATVALDGEVVGIYSAAGETVLDTAGWTYGLHTLTHTSGGETLTAQFEKLIPPPPTVANLSARQRYPWNGLVDIECDIAYEDADADLEVYIVATNAATGEALPVRTILVAGGEGIAVKAGRRHFIWDAGADIAEKVKFDMVALNVTAEVWLGGGVQLWENGPYWAECNVGASQPEEYGYYFWWGDTVGYRRNAGDNGWVSVKDGASFSWDNGSTCGKSVSQLQSAGYIDATGNLVAAHDAATAHLGAPWRMPTDAEWGALISNCDTERTTRNDCDGKF